MKALAGPRAGGGAILTVDGTMEKGQAGSVGSCTENESLGQQ
jgi:hypothetical protein